MATMADLQSISPSPQAQDVLLKAYTPSPQDGKFAADLYLALQHHAPLTLLQKIFFVVTVVIPGPITWKLAVFEFLNSLSALDVVVGFAVVFLLLILYFFFRKLGKRRITKQQPLTFLELTLPAATAKTAYATEQLFTLLHTLAGQRRLSHRLLGYKKQYALELVATREEGIRYILAIPGDDAQIIQKSLLSFLPGLKIKEISDYLPTNIKATDRDKLRIVELKLASDFALPLKKHKTLDEHDPIAFLTGNMTKLQPDEIIAFQVIATPLVKTGNRRIFRHIDKVQQRIYANQPLNDTLTGSLWQKLLNLPGFLIKLVLAIIKFCFQFLISFLIDTWDTNKESGNKPQIMVVQDVHNPYEQELQTEVKEKVDQPLFETSLRLLVHSDDPKQRRLRISGFLAAFGSLGSTYQALTMKGHGLLFFLQPPLPTFATRQLSFVGNPILSAAELTDIYHFPHPETTKTEDLVRSKSQPLPAPLPFKKASTKFDNVFATNSYGGSETPIGQTLEERRRHTYVLGATGSGKTTLLSTMIYQDIMNGKGVGVLDPHGQLIEKLLSVIPKERINDVVWFAPDDDEYPVALNLLEINRNALTGSQLQKQKSLISSSLISVIQKFYDAKFFGPRMEYILRNTILTALETPEPTLQTILDLLTKAKYRKEVVAGLKNKVLQDYWVYEFEKLGQLQKNTVISPITNKIGGLLSSPINYNILQQTKSKIDFEEIMNSGKILLCDLSKGKIGEDESSFFGSLIISKIQLAALRRALVPEEKRRDFYLYVDEFQNFATPTFSELVSEARKYHLATILAHQSISQIEDRDVIKVILANVGTVICFRTANPEDEEFILPIFTPEVAKHEITNLPLYNFYMKVSVGGSQDAFVAQANNFTVEGSNKTTTAAITASRKHYANPVPANDQATVADEDSETPPTKKLPEPITEKAQPETDKESEPKAEGVLP